MEERRSFGISGSLRDSQHRFRQCQQFRADLQPRLSRRIQIYLEANLVVFGAKSDRAAVLRESVSFSYRENRQRARAGQHFFNVLSLARSAHEQDLALLHPSRTIQVFHTKWPLPNRLSVQCPLQRAAKWIVSDRAVRERRAGPFERVGWPLHELREPKQKCCLHF